MARTTKTANGRRRTFDTLMVLRTLYIPSSLDSYLRKRALRESKSKNEIIREILSRDREEQLAQT